MEAKRIWFGGSWVYQGKKIKKKVNQGFGNGGKHE